MTDARGRTSITTRCLSYTEMNDLEGHDHFPAAPRSGNHTRGSRLPPALRAERQAWGAKLATKLPLSHEH